MTDDILTNPRANQPAFSRDLARKLAKEAKVWDCRVSLGEYAEVTLTYLLTAEQVAWLHVIDEGGA